jgi:hypothetical protein
VTRVSREADEDFIAGDPFAVHQVVARWTVVEWNEALYCTAGRAAVSPCWSAGTA